MAVKRTSATGRRRKAPESRRAVARRPADERPGNGRPGERLERFVARAAAGDASERGGVPEIQRARVLAALVEVARERGAGQVTVAHVVERSGISRRTFYELFEDRDDCFVAAFEQAVARAALRIPPILASGEAGASKRVWLERMRLGLRALLEFLDDEPGLGGLCVVDAMGAGTRVLERRARVAARLVDAVDEGREVAQAGLVPSRMTAEGVVGGVLSVLYARLADSHGEPLARLQNPLMGMIVLPYLGPAAAARELARPVPEDRPRVRQSRSNPLEGLGMRLTYRTVRVLVAIAEQPGASNREVADAAGVHDQGQISKLLARLQSLELVANDGDGSSRGEPNAWQLTARGREVEQAILPQLAPADA